MKSVYTRLALGFGGLVCAAAAWSAPLSADQVPTADERSRVLRYGTRHDAVYGMAFDGANGVAVGAFGIVLDTADGGHVWSSHKLPTKGLSLLAVASRGGRRIAVGQSGQIWRSDGKTPWEAVQSGTASRLLGVSVNTGGLAYAVGAFGTLLRSPDGGNTWSPVSPDWSTITPDGAEPHLYGVQVRDDGAVTVVGEFGLVLRGDAGGRRWAVLHKGDVSLFGMTVSEDGRSWYVVGQSGQMLASPDGGASWTTLQTGTSALLTGVALARGGEIVVSGINTLMRSRDGGKTWKSVGGLPANAWLQSVVTVSGTQSGPNEVVTGGAGGLVLAASF